MPGPAPKHPSRRARRNDAKADFTTLKADAKVETPPWPLLPDPETTATIELLDDRVANMNGELADCEDGRTKARLRKQINEAEMQVAILRAKQEQAADLEVALWELLWSSPQAALWDASVAFERTLAIFVRYQIRGEQGHLASATEARQISDRLGLSPMALQKLRAEIENAEAAEDAGRKRRGSSVLAAPPESDEGDDPRLVLVG